MPKRTIALVGAYERDNFGDLLFSYVTEKYLNDFDIILTAPLKGSVDDLLQYPVYDYRTVFESDEQIDGVWTVGGMLGGARPNSPIGHYPGQVPAGPEGLESPYIPRMSKYRKLRDVPFIVNSSSIGNLGKTLQGARVKQALREADIVSVRDYSSLSALNAYGVLGTAAPDIVHALGRVIPAARQNNQVMVQFTKHYFDKDQLEKLAQWLASSTALQGLPITLWAAGIAPGHDSLEQYKYLATTVREINPDSNIAVMDERNPVKIAEAISGASLIIGTSLHARIVASAYNRPRIAWERPKLRSYCENWDTSFPFDATLDNIELRCSEALNQGNDRSGNRLSLLADRNIRMLVDGLHEQLEVPNYTRLLRRGRHLNEYAIELQELVTKLQRES